MTCPTFSGIAETLSEFFEIEENQGDANFTEERLIEKLRDKVAVFKASNARFSKEVIERNPQLKIISAMTVGYDNIDIAACTGQGVVVTNTPDVINQTTADFAWALLLATAR